MKMKAPLIVLCALLLVVASVMGTLAFLTSTTDVVKNTFSVGDVKITLDETDVDVNGVKDGETRVTENAYKLMPGHTYVKDPIVHVDASSENCWLFVKVVNEIADIEDKTTGEDGKQTTIAAQMKDLGWTLVNDQTNVYAYKEIVAAGANVTVFNNFKVDSSVLNAALALYADKTVQITGYAVQADGFTTAAAAWEAAPATWTQPAAPVDPAA